jgi:tRNA dimethylallyltransferase
MKNNSFLHKNQSISQNGTDNFYSTFSADPLKAKTGLPMIVIMGPTGSGKSELALNIGKRLPCEIISGDSMQVYKGMDIGTAKPTIDEQKMVKHHLIDILDIQKRLDVYFYVRKAERAIKELREKGKIPLIVGGSGMYIRALLYGLDPLPASADLRAELQQRYGGNDGNKNLIKDMAKVDPAALKTFGNNQRKLLRALEVFSLTSKSITKQHETWEGNKLRYPVFAYFVSRERAELFKRIENRTVKMLSNGWIDETKTLIEKNLFKTPTARQAIGYEIISKYLLNEISYDEMKVRIVASTKKFARRQETWFNNQHPEAQKITMKANLESLADDICLKLKA